MKLLLIWNRFTNYRALLVLTWLNGLILLTPTLTTLIWLLYFTVMDPKPILFRILVKTNSSQFHSLPEMKQDS